MNLLQFSEKWNGLLSELLVEIFLDGRISVSKEGWSFCFLIGKQLNNVVDLSTFYMIFT